MARRNNNYSSFDVDNDHERFGAGRLLFLALAILILSGGAYFGYDRYVRDNDLQDDNCSKSRPPTTIVTVAIDASDPFQEVQQKIVESAVRTAVGTLGTGDRLEMYVLNARKGGLATRLFSMCNPGEPSKFDQLTINANDTERDYKNKFQTALENALKTAVHDSASDQSPILESIRAIVALSYPPDTANARKKIILVSDLIQNSSVYSVFKSGSADFNKFASSSEYANAQTNLNNISIEALVVMRSQYARYQTRSLLPPGEQ